MSSNQAGKPFLEAITEILKAVGNSELKILQALSAAHYNSNNEKH